MVLIWPSCLSQKSTSHQSGSIDHIHSLWRLNIKQAAKRCCLAWLKVGHRPDLRAMFIIEIGWKGCTMARFGAECLKETPQRIAVFSDLTFGAPFHNDCKEYRPWRCHPKRKGSLPRQPIFSKRLWFQRGSKSQQNLEDTFRGPGVTMGDVWQWWS